MTSQANPSSRGDSDPSRALIPSDEAMRLIVEYLAARYKGIDPEVDRRLDEAAPMILGLADTPIAGKIKEIVGEIPGSNRVPPYFRGGPGEGKTTAIIAGCKLFCEIAGLNFLENPPADYKFGPKDFFYADVSLSGQNSIAAAAGGILMRHLYNGDTEERAKALATLFENNVHVAAAMVGIEKVESKEVKADTGNVLTVTIEGPNAAALARINEAALGRLNDSANEMEVPIVNLQDGVDPSDEAVSIAYKLKDGKLQYTIHVPHALSKKAEYVASVLPSLRMHQVRQAPFALVNFDDVANATPQLMDACLSLAQYSQYGGVADLGRAAVTFTGNLGTADNTNARVTSDALLTRCAVYDVEDTPENWSKRVLRTTADLPGGDQFLGDFIYRFHKVDGVFRDNERQSKGTQKANSRSLVNIIAKVAPLAAALRTVGANEIPLVLDHVMERVGATAGLKFAGKYEAYIRGIYEDVIPAAREALNNKGFASDTLATLQKSVADRMDKAKLPVGSNEAAIQLGAVLARLGYESVREDIVAAERTGTSLGDRAAGRLAEVAALIAQLGGGSTSRSSPSLHAASQFAALLQAHPNLAAEAQQQVKARGKHAKAGLAGDVLAALTDGVAKASNRKDLIEAFVGADKPAGVAQRLAEVAKRWLAPRA